MNKPEAEQELSLLEERERIAWAACNAKLGERDAYEKLWLSEYNKLNAQWSPMNYRKQQLKAYLEIA